MMENYSSKLYQLSLCQILIESNRWIMKLELLRCELEFFSLNDKYFFGHKFSFWWDKC